MPAPHPRRPWRFTLASAVSATLLAVVAGCGEPSHAGHAAAAVFRGNARHVYQLQEREAL